MSIHVSSLPSSHHNPRPPRPHKPNGDEPPPRTHNFTLLPPFPSLSDAYSPSLRHLAFLTSHYLSHPPDALAEGTYAWVSGPTYESLMEGRFWRNAGADVVGMSNVPEVLAAREEGLKVISDCGRSNFSFRVAKIHLGIHPLPDYAQSPFLFATCV
jgi:purine nucleoside phosphorylase